MAAYLPTYLPTYLDFVGGGGRTKFLNVGSTNYKQKKNSNQGNPPNPHLSAIV